MNAAYLAGIDTPAVVIDIDQIEANLNAMSSLVAASSVRLRPHVKTHKTVEIARMQLDHGARGLTVAKLSEVWALLSSGCDDVFVAYPIVGQTKVRNLIELNGRISVRSCITDISAARALSSAAQEAGQTLQVLVDVETGLRRTGIDPEAAFALGIEAASLPGLRVAGVFSYAGYPLKDPDRDVRRDWAHREARTTVEVAQALRDRGIEAETVSVAGTLAAEFAVEVEGVTEVRPGTYVFNDANTVKLGVGSFDECALRVVATVISTPSPDRVVLDAGSKILAADQSADAVGFGYLPAIPTATVRRLWEEHAVVDVDVEEVGLEVGDRVEVIPNHVCPVVNLVDELTCVQEGQIVATWEVIARGCLS